MKLKNETLKCKIVDVAKLMFYKDGYKNVSIRDIAMLVETTPSNIYSYFSSKEDLLDAVVKKQYKAIMKIVEMDIDYENLYKHPSILSSIVKNVIDELVKMKYEFLILFTKCQESKYENLTDEVKRKVAEAIYQSSKEPDTNLCTLYSNSVCVTVINIIEQYIDDEEEIKRLCYLFITQLFKKI